MSRWVDFVTTAESEDLGAQKPESFYLIIKSGRGKSSDYRCCFIQYLT
jgi:hypothetical protein